MRPRKIKFIKLISCRIKIKAAVIDARYFERSKITRNILTGHEK